MPGNLEQLLCDGAVPDVVTSTASRFVAAVLFEYLDQLGNLHGYAPFMQNYT